MSPRRRRRTDLQAGVKQFQREHYPQLRARFQELADGQLPDVLFITCADSRIDPALITGTLPGQLFVMRNAGNVVPPYGVASGEAAAIEYALEVLGVAQVVVCGHSGCGAVQAAAGLADVSKLTDVQAWLHHLPRLPHARTPTVEDVAALCRRNVALQLERLHSYPAIDRALHANEIQLLGWYYDIPSGRVETVTDTGNDER